MAWSGEKEWPTLSINRPSDSPHSPSNMKRKICAPKMKENARLLCMPFKWRLSSKRERFLFDDAVVSFLLCDNFARLFGVKYVCTSEPFCVDTYVFVL